MTESKAPQEPQKVAEQKSKILTFLSHPVVAIIVFISAIVGLISLPLSFYFYYAAKEYPQLSYYVSPAKAVVVKAGQVSRLTTSYDGKVIDTDITAAQVALWNAGSKAVKGADILQPVVIQTDNNIPLLEATIRKTSREVTQLVLNTDELQKGRVIVSWNILERNDGGVIQLIYAGNPETNIQVAGVIEGQQQIQKRAFSEKIKSADEQYISVQQNNRIGSYILLGASILLALVITYSKFKERKTIKEHEKFQQTLSGLKGEELSKLANDLKDKAKATEIRTKKIDRIVDTVGIIFVVFILGLALYLLLLAQTPSPPFGF